jgi:hypothetical protein
LRINFNSILASMPRPSMWYRSSRFPHHNPVCTCSLPDPCSDKMAASSDKMAASSVRNYNIATTLSTPHHNYSESYNGKTITTNSNTVQSGVTTKSAKCLN